MATTTPKMGLRKPAGTDLVTVGLDINANMDLIDTAEWKDPTSGFRGILLNPAAGGTNPHGEIETRGDQCGLKGTDAAGNSRFLFGLRSDIVGNAVDVILYSYSGSFRVFPNTGEALKVDSAAVAGGTSLTVLANGLGNFRIFFGAAGTGPGGVGRALYI